ncbi:hypothetical protein HNP38_001456 [Chryseobacterium defluvii]|uniref:Hyaluronidase n=1 Tax=Chryseobacterium defluvii TaxID=160396 RepID=A0A840KEM6_9FLAO|nr:hypothetical protein [Chryseobacterium defluvii]MBB4806184.1 hypothetical protein [Chryseobacterium defluvii]
MKTVFVNLLFCLLISTSCNSQKNKNEKNELAAIPKENVKVLYQLGVLSNDTKKQFNTYGFEEINFVDESCFFSKEKFVVDAVKLRQKIKEIFPDAGKAGYAYINLESPYIEMIRDKEAGDPEFKKALAYFIQIVRICKEERPMIKWGFYAVPFTTFWEIYTGYFRKNDKISALLKEVDVFYPSMYMFYDEDVDMIKSIGNDNYLEKNTENAISLSIKYKKPVFPFILHRYHPSNAKVGWKQMDDLKWKNYISGISSAEVNKKHVDGIVWWGADDFFYGRTDAPNITNEYKGGKKEYIEFNSRKLSKKATQIIQNWNKK